MTSYDFGLSGSVWLLVLSCLIGFALSIFVYRTTVPPISTRRKVFMIFLRGSGLALLLFILFEPLLNLVKVTEEPARVAVMLDNSQSAAMQDASVDRRAQYTAALAEIDEELFSDDNRVLRFDRRADRIENFAPDSLDFNGELSNISSAFKDVFNDVERDNIRALVLVSDGAFNAGQNPIYDAELLGRPVYTVGIGDSTEPRDVSVQTIITNELAYVGVPAPVNVNVRSSGYSEGEIAVRLLDNGAVIDEQIVQLREGANSYSLVFEYLPNEEGTRKIEARIDAVEGELTDKNNRVVEFVRVLKSKRKVVILAGAPTPDLGFVRSTLESNKNVEVSTFIQKKGAEYIGAAPTPADLVQAELIITIGFPVSSTSPEVVQMLAGALERGRPLMFMASREIDYVRLRPLEPYLPFNVSASQQRELLVTPDVPPTALGHPIMKIDGSGADGQYWNAMPPVFRTETFVKVKPEADVLASIRVNNAPLNEPLIAVRTLQNRKSMAVFAYGLFRWKTLGYAAEISRGRTQTPDVFTSFMENSVRWLTTRDQGKLVRVKTSREQYSSGERVEVIGQVYDETYEPLENADVRVRITGAEEPRDIVLTPLGGGRYSAEVEGLPQGEYSFDARVLVNDAQYGTDNGRFSIGEVSIEFQNPRMNAALLRTLSERTGGKFFAAGDLPGLYDAIKQHRGFQARPVSERSEIALWNLPWLLAAAVLLFGLEWFMRKRSGMV